jgi:dynein heavy chain, axonemal
MFCKATKIKLHFRQEIDRIQRVNSTVLSTLCDLKLAIDGTIVMSQGLRESLDAMYDARIPEKWKKVHFILYISMNLINRGELQ